MSNAPPIIMMIMNMAFPKLPIDGIRIFVIIGKSNTNTLTENTVP